MVSLRRRLPIELPSCLAGALLALVAGCAQSTVIVGGYEDDLSVPLDFSHRSHQADLVMPGGDGGSPDLTGLGGDVDLLQEPDLLPPPACNPGQTGSAPCGNCGTMMRACDNNGVWGAFGSCAGQGACAAGATRNMGCGNCGMQTDTCNNSCQWTAGGCGGQGACAPGQTKSAACGNCGTQTDTCNGSCQWVAGGCANQGPCAPGATQAGGCDKCSEQVCGGNCQWNGCTLRGGNACEYKAGTNHRACKCTNACAGTPLQFCLNSCQWSTQCACCGGGCVNC